MRTTNFVRTLCLGSLLVLPACGKSKLLRAMEDYEKEACACTDHGCVQKAVEKAMDLSGQQPSNGESEAFTKAFAHASECAAAIALIDAAKVDRAHLDIANILEALKVYQAKKGNYPDTGNGFKAVVDVGILEKMPVDPWDHEYVYLNEGGKPVVISYGKDGAPGGADSDADISSKDSRKWK